MEKERNEFRLTTDRLESRVGRHSPLAVELIFFFQFGQDAPCQPPSFHHDACRFVQIADLLAELADERSTSESASQLLETETSERLRLEKDLKDLQARTRTHAKVKKACRLKETV